MARHRDRPRGRNRRRRGYAMMIVLLLIMALTVVVWMLQREVARELSVGTNFRDDLSAANMARLGLARGAVMLKLDEQLTYDSLNEAWSKPLSWIGEKFGMEEGEDTGSDRKEPMVVITDEERKFNLLLLVRGTEAQRKQAVEVLSRLIDICRREDDRLGQYLEGDAKTVRRKDDDSANTKTLVSNLLKYLEERASEDSDDLEFTADASGKADVRGMKKQTPFQMLTLGELLQVEGWTHTLLYGRPRQSPGQQTSEQNGQEQDNRQWIELTEEEKFMQSRDQLENLDMRSRDPEPLPLAHYLTLYSSGRININTCSRELLLALDEKLSWDVVDTIITAREQARRDVVAAEENNGTLPESAAPVTGEEPEDEASFRPQDIATYQAFVARASNSEDLETGTLEGLTPEMFAAFRPLLSVRSTVFRVESSAKVGKMTNTIYALYRRTGTQTPAPAPGAPGTPAPAPTPAPTSSGDAPLPAEPTARLTLLFMDVKGD